MDIDQAYNDFLRPLREEMAQLSTRYGGRLRCGPGCCDCCGELSVLPLEAARITTALAGLSHAQQSRIHARALSPARACPFLLDRLCAIYPARPLICRTHGLPVAYINEEEAAIEVSACPHNFPPEAELEQDGLLFLDRHIQALQDLNQYFAREKGCDPFRRTPLRGLVLTPKEKGDR